MAIETLKHVESIGQFSVDFTGNNPNQFINISGEDNTIKFKLQNGPIKENGVNGCQVDTLIEAVICIIDGLNQRYPCRENSLALTKLEEALLWLGKRKADREKRGVEGTNAK